MIVVRPSWDNPIFVEWRKWQKIVDEDFSPMALEAKRSIEKIAEHIYTDGCVVGFMLMETAHAEETQGGAD